MLSKVGGEEEGNKVGITRSIAESQLPPPSHNSRLGRLTAPVTAAAFDACLRRRLAPNLRVWPKPTGSACLCWAARGRSSGYLTSGLFPHLRPRFGASPREGDEGEGRRDGQEVLHQVEDAGALRIQLRPRHALHRPVGLPLSHPREALDLAMRFLCSWGPWGSLPGPGGSAHWKDRIVKAIIAFEI